MMEHYDPPTELWLHVLYQDDHIIVVNKPSGLLSVPGKAPEHRDSIMTRVQRDFPGAESVHRLDMATSGVMVVALTKAAERELKRQFREREPKKAISRGCGGIWKKMKGLSICRLFATGQTDQSKKSALKPVKARKPNTKCSAAMRTAQHVFY